MRGSAVARWHDAALAGTLPAPYRGSHAYPSREPVAGRCRTVQCRTEPGTDGPGSQAQGWRRRCHRTGKVSTLGEAKPGGRLLTREELRACLKQKTELAERRPPMEAERAQLDRERQELQQIDESLKAERASIEKLTETAADIGKRGKELSAQTADFNDRAARFQTANASGPTASGSATHSTGRGSRWTRAPRPWRPSGQLGPAAEQKVKAFDARVASRERAACERAQRQADAGGADL